MSNGPKAFFNQTDLKHVPTTRYLGQKTFRLESSRSEYTAPNFVQISTILVFFDKSEI